MSILFDKYIDKPTCERCDGAGYIFEGSYSFNDEQNIRIPCTKCDSDAYDDLDYRLKR